MSERNGDRARFNKDRKRKRLHRERIHAMAAGTPKPQRHGGRRRRAAPQS